MFDVNHEFPVMLSALQHYAYCPRQCALIHLEQSFDENVFTLRGQALHKTVDEPDTANEAGRRVETALPLFSERLGLIGKADVVEFDAAGVPYPIEYKHGPRRPKAHDDIQLAAQAMCLEEMLGVSVSIGAIFHHSSRRRREVMITEELRALVTQTVAEVRKLWQTKLLPEPVNDDRCRHCSLADLCQPTAVASRAKVQELRKQLFRLD